jgi:hypothetical protein
VKSGPEQPKRGFSNLWKCPSRVAALLSNAHLWQLISQHIRPQSHSWRPPMMTGSFYAKSRCDTDAGGSTDLSRPLTEIKALRVKRL